MSLTKTILTITLLFIGLIGSAQVEFVKDLLENDEGYSNYVSNPGFEETKREYCKWNQNGRNYMESIIAWDSPTETTPDLFSLRVKNTCWANPRKHSNGKQGPRNGDNMAGLKTYGKGGTETFWHEYLSVELDSTLVPGQRYYAEFYTSRASNSKLASNNLGMYFSDTAVVTRDRMPLFFTPMVNSDKVIKSRWNAWQKVSGVFEVEEEKRFLLIGNFYHDSRTEIQEFDDGEGGAYYYIDDVKVRRALPEEELTPQPKRSIPPKPKTVLRKAELVSTKDIKLDSIAYKVGDRITLENIFFEFDKAELLPESKKELDKLVDILTDYPFLKIEIGGHTDNVGGEAYNKTLSEERAKSVVDYLIGEDVNDVRLSYNGYGAERPITSNATDEGRARNRRVEFVILSN
ncbi:MAG TPA: OmpA family protein [Cryomorphaceae bacterium]|nr:OmpA family protein [Cryomorphaceae bacterium]